MTQETNDLRDIFLAVSEEGIVTEHQIEGASKTTVEKDAVAVAEQAAVSTLEDGLDDAVGGPDSGWAIG